MIRFTEALVIDTFYHITCTNKDGSRLRARRTGKTKVWKTRPGEFKIPVKYGLKESFYITHLNKADWSIFPIGTEKE